MVEVGKVVRSAGAGTSELRLCPLNLFDFKAVRPKPSDLQCRFATCTWHFKRSTAAPIASRRQCKSTFELRHEVIAWPLQRGHESCVPALHVRPKTSSQLETQAHQMQGCRGEASSFTCLHACCRGLLRRRRLSDPLSRWPGHSQIHMQFRLGAEMAMASCSAAPQSVLQLSFYDTCQQQLAWPVSRCGTRLNYNMIACRSLKWVLSSLKLR